MKNLTEITTRMRRHYIGNGFIQIMCAYQESLAVIGNEGIKYGRIIGKETINSYLDDKRKNIFPYSRIPEHFELGFSNNYKYVNQILNINEPYIEVLDRHLQELYVTQGEEGTFLTTKILLSEKEETFTMTREELDKLCEGKIIISIPYGDIGRRLINEEEILNGRKEDLLNFLRNSSKELYTTPLLYQDLKQLESLIDHLTLEDITKKVQFESLLLVSTENNQLNARLVQSTFMDVNNYRVKISNVPLTIANLDYIKSKHQDLTNIKYQGEPRITYIENHYDYSLALIKEENRRARKLKRM